MSQLMSRLVGAFRREVDDEPSRSWQCPICSTVNVASSDDTSESCKICQRLRSPEWLRLEDSGIQVTLGSRVFHTSVGGSKSVSIVVAINYIQQAVTVLRVKSKQNDRNQHGDISFHEVVLNATQMQQQLEFMDAEQEEDCVVGNYGVCGDCHGVFRVVHGDPQSQYANEDKVNELQKELQQLDEQKQRFAKEKMYERTLECTEQIKMKMKQFQVAKRELEFLSPIFCPFCGWHQPDKECT